jgi:multidrug efflux pump subunit AcrB
MLVDVVGVALKRPYTFVVMALLMLVLGPLAAVRTPTDIFPEIRIPVIAVAWAYTGLPPDQMAGRITNLYQRVLTTTVNDIEHIEANSYAGVGIVKIFFHPGVNIAVANAQVTAISQVMIRQMPPGALPPLIVQTLPTVKVLAPMLRQTQLFPVHAKAQPNTFSRRPKFLDSKSLQQPLALIRSKVLPGSSH